jgi:hypothetical protein
MTMTRTLSYAGFAIAASLDQDKVLIFESDKAGENVGSSPEDR